MILKKLVLSAIGMFLVIAILFAAGTVTAATSAHVPGAPRLVQAVPTWQQVNTGGFGDSLTDEVSALAAFNGDLYAGTHNPIDPGPLYDGARIFRSTSGTTWTPVTQPGFGIAHDIAPPAILDLEVFNGRIYASTGRGDGPGQIWRSTDGTIWAPMVIHGFNDQDNVDISTLAVYKGILYAGVTNLVNGAQVWRSLSGDNNTWMQVAPVITGTDTASITGFAVFSNTLYAVVESNAPVQIWQSNGADWTTIVDNGFGNSNTTLAGGIAQFAGYLYVGAGNTVDGAQLWRTANGASWIEVIIPASGDANNQKVEQVFVFQNTLYISVRNTATGIEVWRSPDGSYWEQANPDGFGDGNNTGTNWSNATAVFQCWLYTGTMNLVDGGELWRAGGPCNSLFMPLIVGQR